MTPEFSRPIPVDRIGPRKKRFNLVADLAERTALAARYDILGVNSLLAEIFIHPFSKGYRLQGRLTAEVVQACVVTLEPVIASVTEEFEVTFAKTDPLVEAREVDLDPYGDDPPEPILNGEIDLGEVVSEHLALALDPFPRAADAVFSAIETDEMAEPVKASPFAALAALKKK